MSRKPYALLSLAAIVLTTGCTGTPEQFAKTAARLECKRSKECDKSFFDEEYGGDLGRCKGDREDFWLDLNDELDDIGCDYDKDEAKKCVKAVRSNKNDCSDDADEDIADECAEVWDCPSGLEFDPDEGAIIDFVHTPDEDIDVEEDEAEPATYPADDAEYIAPPVR